MKKIYLLVLLFANFLYSQSNFNWQILNPKPTSNYGKDVLFVSETEGFYITDKELVETKNAGKDWSVKMQISSGVDIDFKNNTGLIVGNRGSCYLSIDNGLYWNSLNINSLEDFIYCKVIDSNTLIMVSTTNIFFSKDRGVTWSKRNITTYNPKKAYFINENTGFLGTSDGKMYKTIDGGITWILKSSVNYIPSDYFTIYFYNDLIGFAERGHGELLKTSDGGETWTLIKTISDRLFSFSFLNENLGYATGEYGVTFKTIDGGKTWNNIFFQTGRIGGTDMYGIFFTSENTGYAVGLRGRIIKTIDGGINWNEYSPFYDNINNINIVENQIFARVGLFIFKSEDNGGSWQKLNRPSDFIPDNPWTYTNYSAGMKFLNKNVGYLIGGNSNDDSKIFKTIDGGNSWVLKKDFFVYGLNDFCFINESIGYVCGGQGTMGNALYKTSDGGDNWTLLNTTFQFRKIKAFNENLLFASTYGNLYKSIDGGQNWKLIYNYDNREIRDFYFTDENTIFLIGTPDQKLQKSSDGGVTWIKYDIPYNWYDLVRFKNKNIGFIATEYGQIYTTFNGGRTWDSDYNYYGSRDMLFSNNDIILAGNNGKIFKGIQQSIPEYILITNEVNIMNKSASFKGSAASNSMQINNLTFEYSKTPYFSQPAYKDPNKQIIDANDSDDLFASASDLEASTTYYVRLTGIYNGQKIYGNTVSFTTLPNYELKLNEVYPRYASTVNLYGMGSAIGNDITNLEFEYSENQNTFTNSVPSTPQTILLGNNDTSLTTKLQNLKPETIYYARVKANYENNIIYSNTVSFKTAKEYNLTLDEAFIYNGNINLNATVSANDKEITEIAFEYGDNYENSLNATPSMVSAISFSFLSAALQSSLFSTNKNYYVRLKAKTNGKTIYSNSIVFNLDKSLILAKSDNEILSENSIQLTGFVKNYDYYPLTNISFEYGKTTDLGTIIPSLPNNYYYNNTTLKIISTLEGLETNQKYYYKLSAIQNGVKKYSDLYEFTINNLSTSDFHVEKISIYPNPVKEKLYFKSNKGIFKIELYDFSGNLLIFKKGENIESLDVKNLTNKNYIIKLYTHDGIISKKIIKL